MKKEEEEQDKKTVTWAYPITKILELRNSLVEILRCEFENKIIDSTRFDRLVTLVYESMPIVDLDFTTVYESCRCLAGVFLDEATIRLFSHRMAGNMPRLRTRRPVMPWSLPQFPEWVPFQIIAVKRHRPAKKVGGLFSFVALAGTPAGLIYKRWWSLRYCRWISRKFGFSRPASQKAVNPARYPFSVVEQLVTLRVLGYVEPVLCRPGEPVFEKMKTPATMAAWNREQLKHRFRIDKGYECQEGKPRTSLCHNCPTGYMECRGGTHARNYLFRPCPTCKQPLAPFDPEWATPDCVNCHNASQKAGAK